MLNKRLAELKKEGKFDGKFAANYHFFGYEGRCGIPSNFDANYSYALGYSAAILALNNLSGYMASVRNLTKPASQWTCGGIPITMLLHLERRKGEYKPVIKKALVDLNAQPFKAYEKLRTAWAQNEDYIFPGPIQYFGPKSIVDMTTKTLQYEHK
jgi:pyrophosphate--fructose-6-phosphate 1-phosphotransferase